MLLPPVDFAGAAAAAAVFGVSAALVPPPPPPPPLRDALSLFFDLRELEDPLLDAVGEATAAAEGGAGVVGGGSPVAPLRAAAGDGVNPLRRENAAGVGPPLPAAAARSRHDRSVTDGVDACCCGEIRAR